MTTELQLQQGFQTGLQALSIFDSGSVYINEDDFLDKSVGNAPYAVVWTSQAGRLSGAMGERLVGNITVTISLIEEFVGYGDTYDNIRTNRQAISNYLLIGTGNSAGGLSGVEVVDVGWLPFVPIYPVGTSEEAVNSGQAFPVFMEVPIAANVRLF